VGNEIGFGTIVGGDVGTGGYVNICAGCVVGDDAVGQSVEEGAGSSV